MGEDTLSEFETLTILRRHGLECWTRDDGTVSVLVHWSQRAEDGSLTFGRDEERIPANGCPQDLLDWLGY